MLLLRNAVRPYSWGSRTAIPSLTGRPYPTARPEAEMWIGAHPDDSPTVLLDGDERSLADPISADPVAMVGDRCHAAFGPRLPYLMKLLAAAEPLSLQAHPSEDQAADGHRRERAAGVSRDAAHRNYRDRSDKPGLICALTECHALCGFRVESETLDLLTTLDVRGLDPLVSIFAELGPSAIRRAFDLIMHLPGAALAELVPHVLEACAELSGSGHRFALEYQTVRHAGPQLLFAVDGEMLVRDRHGRERRVPQGGSTWIPAGHCPVSIHGTGSLFRATDGVSGEPSALPGGNNQGGSDR